MLSHRKGLVVVLASASCNLAIEASSIMYINLCLMNVMQIKSHWLGLGILEFTCLSFRFGPALRQCIIRISLYSFHFPLDHCFQKTWPWLRPWPRQLMASLTSLVTIIVDKPFATGQPTRPTQPFILFGSIN